MKKYQEKKITKWLNKQSSFASKLLKLSFLLNILNISIIIFQNWILAIQVQYLFFEIKINELFYYYIMLVLCFIFKSLLNIIINKVNYNYSQLIKNTIRNKILDKFEQIYLVNIKNKTLGSILSLIIDQIENIQDFYNKYIPQLLVSIISPIIILITISFISWFASVLLIIISMFTIFFIILIGSQTAQKNKKNFKILSILNGLFLDRLLGMETIRLFNMSTIEINKIAIFIEKFRKKSMEILKIAFLTSAVLEFFSSIALASIAIYFSFSYLNVIKLGFYGKNITIFNGFFILILTSEYFQYFINLGLLYHIKSKSIGAADLILQFLENNPTKFFIKTNNIPFNEKNIFIQAKKLIVKNIKGNILIGPISFKIFPGEHIGIIGPSGCGKTTLFNVFLGFLPYNGSLKINNIELKNINLYDWYKKISWVGQNASLPGKTIRKNLFFDKNIDTNKIQNIIKIIKIKSFLKNFPDGLDTIIGEQNIRLSVGQIQRIIVARALIKNHNLLLLDEPTANIDMNSERDIINSLYNYLHKKTMLIITHKLYQVKFCNQIWEMYDGKIIKKIVNDRIIK
ncbi:ATP-binding cassette domain-containing protein [Enterobacteriaceae endosymbiont of Plateumaris consimilis]|uniref:ATP-binding cassette domain-containing protein n=1 Tax=Enterobacteriaceae endosymbiont of Plateumaris consimilis TaxID=2675794 RepID=UPI00144A2487|nr:ATP-binding cassette domain-containing protein [Enterobacteriaceae endosymbiont of Plateumaris consimilis]QJC28840.1 ATP-binding cassette domain-containing protein [Enterobacteriaceae endosymbiont of Plateumaris consimilis]